MKQRSLPQKSQPAALYVVTFAIFTDMLVYGLVVPILPQHALALGASQIAIGFLFGSYSIALVLTAPIVGIISDRVGRRGPLLWGLLGLASATLLFAFANTFPLLVLARALQGISASATWTAGLALLADLFPSQERGKAMGIALSGMAMGTLIGPTFGGLLSQWGGYRFPFLVATGFALLDGLARVFFLHEPAQRTREQQFDLRLLHSHSILLVSAVVIVGAAIPSFLEPTLPLHLQRHLGVSPVGIGILFGLPTLAYGIIAPLAGVLTDRLGRRSLMYIGLVGTAVVLPLVALSHSVILEGGVMLLLGITLGLVLTPTLPELSNEVDHLGASGYGVVYALYNLAYFLGLLSGPIAGGVLTGIFGLLVAVVIAAGGVFLFALVAILLK